MRVAAPPADPIARLERLFAGVGVLLMTGALTRAMTGGLSIEEAREVQTPQVQVAFALLYVVATGLIAVRFERYAKLLARNAFVFVPVALAVASVSWSVEPDQTLRRSIGLVGTTIFSVYLGVRFSSRDLAGVLFYPLAFAVVASFALSIAAPGFAVHQAVDSIEHAGRWRGLFFHKNSLGPVAAVCLLLTLALWRRIPAPAAAKAAIAAMSFVIALKSGSAQALFQAVVLSAAILAHRQFSLLPATQRAAAFCIGGATTVLLMVSADAILGTILEALDRDPSLSSRTYLWEAAWIGGLQRPIWGAGFDTGWFGGANVVALQLIYSDPGHAHNGFLTMWLDLGLVGLAAITPVWIVLTRRTLAVADHDYPLYLLSLYFLVYYFTTNYIDSFLMKEQHVTWLFIVTLCAATLKASIQARRVGPVAAARPLRAARAAG